MQQQSGELTLRITGWLQQGEPLHRHIVFERLVATLPKDESHIYPKVTHSFVYCQDLSVNCEAVADAWPRVVAFYNKNLK